MANLTRIKNNQITDNTIVASTKIVPGTITGGLLSNTFSYTGDFQVTGNLTISGTTTTVDTTNTTAADPLIVLNKNTTGTNTYDMGLILERGTSTNTAMIWDEANDQFAMIFTTEVGTTAGSINNTAYADLKVANLALTGAISGVTSGTFGNINIASNTVSTTNTNGDLILDPNGTGAVNLAANTNVTGSLDVTGNIANANVVFANVFTSNIGTGTAPFTVSSTTQVANLNVATAGNLVNGTSNVSIPSTNGNVEVGVAGNANVLVVTGTGANINGTANVTGNLDAGNVSTNIAVITTGNITTINSGLLQNGNSNVAIASNGDVTVSSAGNANILTITGTGANISGTANVTGNLDAGNVSTNIAVITTGNITTVNTGLVQNGNSNVAITANGNIALTATSNTTVVITDLGANITGYANISGNANVGNLGTAGTVIASTLESNITTGTAPLTVTSTTQVANLNVATAGNLVNGNSNVIVDANSNVTVSVAGNANILTVTGTGANISGTANVTGNLDAGNVSTNIAVITTGNITTINSGLMQNGNSNVAIDANGNVGVSVAGNSNVVVITDLGANITGYANITGNLDAGNVSTNIAVITTGNITTINSGLIQNGNSNVAIAANGNVGISVTGNSNVVVITDTGANISGTANVTGNLDAGNVSTNIAVITTGNITTINSGLLQNGNSNVAITANGNIALTATSNTTVVITDLGANITGYANISGNANAGNVGTTNIVMTANLTGANVVFANTFTSNVTTGAPLTINSNTQVANLNAEFAGTLINGTSNVDIPSVNGNIEFGVAGNANIMVLTGTGANITGYANVSGTANVGNLNVVGNSNLGSNANVTITGGSNGQVLQTDGTGNLSWLTVQTNEILNGNSNVSIPTTDGNVYVYIDGTQVIEISNANVALTGNIDVSGNIEANNATINDNLYVNGSFIDTDSASFSIANANATTLDIGGAATTLNLGASTGNTIVNNDLQINGNDIRSSTGNVAITLNDEDVTIVGNLVVQGNTSYVGSQDLVVNDSLINLHTSANLAPLTADDGRDVGIVMHYYKTSDKQAALVWANDTGALEYYQEATETVGGTMTGQYGTIKANLYLSEVATGTAPFTVKSTTQVANLNVAVAGSLINGTSNVSIPSANGNIDFSVGGNANVLVVTGTGANISGTLEVTGNANVGNLTVTGIITGNSLSNGNSNVSVAANGNVSVSVAGNSNVFLVTGTGANVAGYANITGNANIGNVGTENVVLTANLSGANVIFANTFTSNVATGTAPFTVSSTTQVANLNVAVAGNLVNGNSNVIVYANSDIAISSAGNSNVFLVTGTGANINGTGNVTGNLDAGNLSTNVAVITTGNITTINSGLMQNGNSNVAIATDSNVSVSVSGNANVLVVTGTGANINGTGNVTGNLDAGNVSTNIAVITTGNITTINSGLLQNGNSNVAITANGNVTIAATSNTVVTITDLGANITGYANISGNANVGNLGTAGTVIASTLESNVTTGTAPLTVVSTTQVANLNVATAGNLVNGNSNVVVYANSDIAVSSAGNSNVFIVTGTGANISGTANVTGNLDAGNVSTNIAVITTGNITTINSGLLQNGNSNVAITANGNVSITATSNTVVTVTDLGANITGYANVTGNLDAGNVSTNIAVITTGNITTINSGLLQNGNSNVAIAANGNVGISVTGNSNVVVITDTGANISGTANVTGNLDAGNVSTNIAVITTGNITTINSGLMQNGNSNVAIAANGNVGISVTGNSNVVVITDTGANIAGTANVTGNLDAGNVSTNIAVITTGNITTINSGLMQNGNSNVAIAANGDVTVSSAGNANILTVNGTTVIANSDIATASTTANLFNANATTLNIGGAATALNLGATTGTTTVNNDLLANANLTVAGFADIGNIYIANNNITTLNTNGNLELDANGTGSIVLNNAGDNTSVIINGNTTSGYTNLLVANASSGQIGILTNTPTAGTAFDVNANTAVKLATGTTGERPAGVTGMLRYNTTDNGFEYYDGANWSSLSTTFTIVSADSFTGDGSTVAFTLSQSATTASTIVSINGVIQIPTTAYTVSGTTITFTEAPLSTDIIDARVVTTTTQITSLKQGDTEVKVDDNVAISLIFNNVAVATATTTFNVNTAVVSNLAATSVGAATVVIDSFPVATYRSAKYLISVSNSGRGDYETQEVVVVHNGTTAYRAAYGIVESNVSLGTTTVAISGGNVELSYTGNFAGNAVKIYKTYIPV